MRERRRLRASSMRLGARSAPICNVALNVANGVSILRGARSWWGKWTMAKSNVQPLESALDLVEQMLLGQVRVARSEVERRLSTAARLTPDERRRVRAVAAGLRLGGELLNELLDRSGR